MATAQMPVRALEAAQIVKTLTRLRDRVRERFPKRGLADVCDTVVSVAETTARRVQASRRINLGLRIAVAAVLALALFAAWRLMDLAAPAGLATLMRIGADGSAVEIISALESLVNLVILAALAVWFLLSLEARLARRRVLKHLHELRSLAHVVDMHQLTKDPVSILNPGLRMASSPERDLTPGQLARYLDYCVEMLSLIGKLAALYAEDTEDAQIIASANDIEDLTTNLSRKIWQKIMMTGQGLHGEAGAETPTAASPPGAPLD